MTQTTLREYLRTTEDAISSGRIDEAMANCQNILTYFPEALEAQRLLGEVYLAQGHLEEAQQTFEWILTNDPENVIVYCDRALISERVADIDTALDCYQQAYELSRGNANIRQEFNQLSIRAGQQEFMFSRAGLARLYMRGDLLTQAIQEWDAVLAISPDRLDARLGLMETYWRDALYDKAEAIATQLLEEIPTCVKALLYLAHIASISNIQRARELLQRAEALDPELTMAQEIFADFGASQPNDPFLQLIKKEPVLLEDGVPVNIRAVAGAAMPAAQVAPSLPVQSSPTPSLSLDEDWNQVASAKQGIPETPLKSDWKSSPDLPNMLSQSAPDLLDWQAQISPATQKEQPWYQQDQFAGSPAEARQSWESRIPEAVEEEPAPPAWLGTLTSNEIVPPAQAIQAPPVEPQPATKAAPLPINDDEAMPFLFPSDSDENEGESAWPEWLKSLGAEALEPEQPASATPQQAVEADPWAGIAPLKAANESWPESPAQPDWMQQLEQSPASAPAAIPEITPNWMQQPAQAPAPAAQTSTPDWMQQLGQVPEPTPVAQSSTPDWMQQLEQSPAPAAQASTPDWMQQLAINDYTPAQAQSSTPDWMQQLGQVPAAESTPPDWIQQFGNTRDEDAPPQDIPSNWLNQPTLPPQTSNLTAAAREQGYIASLADLEKNLQAEGFVPLAPGALASIAQSQSSAPAPLAQAQQYSEPAPLAQPAAYEEPSIASALAQLGNFSSQPVPAPVANDPWWNAGVSQNPAPSSNPFAALGARTAEELPQQMSPLPATPVPMSPANAFEAAQPSLSPAYRSDALLDSDLETTMKRPAVKLQPMQLSPTQDEQVYHPAKSRHSEHKQVENADDTNLSSQQRLVRGYQYQLSGAYEEAMQDYRIIIRNAPELLDDVISNMRALLKLNPRFSLGYRVLGDAYMRKGEYLQAMESYNKALTMAKKSRG